MRIEVPVLVLPRLVTRRFFFTILGLNFQSKPHDQKGNAHNGETDHCHRHFRTQVHVFFSVVCWTQSSLPFFSVVTLDRAVGYPNQSGQ